MRHFNLLLALTMLGFMAVQYNDDDGLLWAFYYLVPGLWAMQASFHLERLRTVPGSRLLAACIAAWLALVIFYWPQMPNFWLPSVFHAEETAREGMGLMIAWLVLLVAALSARLKPAA